MSRPKRNAVALPLNPPEQLVPVIYEGICGARHPGVNGGDGMKFTFAEFAPRSLCLPGVGHTPGSSHMACRFVANMAARHHVDLLAIRSWDCQFCGERATTFNLVVVSFLAPDVGTVEPVRRSVWGYCVPICRTAGFCDQKAGRLASELRDAHLSGLSSPSAPSCLKCGSTKDLTACGGCKTVRMKVNARKCLVTAALLVFGVRAAEIIPVSNGMDAIPDSYLVVMKDDIQAREFDTHRSWVDGLLHDNAAGKGWGVKYIEQDAVIRALGLVTQKGAGWYLSRISHKKLPPTPEYVYEERAGQNVHIYLLDTGVDGTNSGLRGRVIQGINTTPDGDSDENGHGTSVAEVIAGTVHGVAKKALVVSVKILDNTGSGSISGIIKGLDWSISDVAKRNIVGKAVMNMSLGGAYSASFNQATEKAIKAGIFVAASVGAGNRDASQESPVSANGVCAVAASTPADAPASFGSYGPVVDIYAPGTNITTRIHGDKLVTVSGSSYSASQVSGMAAFIIDMGMSSDKVCETIKKLALPSIQDPKPGTTKLLLYNGSGL
ncbi:hypothetical protein MferCBS31731_006580 [Microsporum ferrugineum]